MAKDIKLSIIITAHNEGLLAHKTMLSVFEATKCLDEAKIKYEIIIHIDNGDTATKNYFKRYKNTQNITIFENSFGDTGPSRNFAASQARGEFIAFLDGDDLISSNWFIEALNILQSKNDAIIVHPEAILTFGIEQPNILTIQKDSKDYRNLPLVLVGENCWCSTLVTRKAIFNKCQYSTVSDGYAHEDYIFNLQTLAMGFSHVVAKNTVLFYRRSSHSRLSQSDSQNAITPYSDYLDFQHIQKTPAPHKQSTNDIKHTLYKTYKKIRNNEKINYFITPFAKIAIKILYPKRLSKKEIPKFVIEEWVKINQIETQLYPYRHVVSNVQEFSPETLLPIGDAYHKISQKIKHVPNYIFIVPWIVRGGADKVLLNYLKALKEIHPDWHFTVISTLPADNPWASLLPDYVDFIDFGNNAASLNPHEQDILFSRIITQLQCKNIHIINSEYGFLWAIKHKALFIKEYHLSTSLFCYEYIPGSKLKGVFSYDDPYMVALYPYMRKIFTDNQSIVDYSTQKNGFEQSKFAVHYQPIDNTDIHRPQIKIKQNSKIHILWAGRITNVKIPQIVAKIGKRLDPEKFVIDVYGVFDSTIKKSIFDNIPAVKYHGSFNGFSSLPIQKSDLFLYTSLTDGIPNTILEATAAGLPIVASNDGGVKEIIKDHQTGVLINDPQDVNSYIDAINEFAKDPNKFIQYANRAQKLIQKQHSWQQFVEQVKKDF